MTLSAPSIVNVNVTSAVDADVGMGSAWTMPVIGDVVNGMSASVNFDGVSVMSIGNGIVIATVIGITIVSNIVSNGLVGGSIHILAVGILVVCMTIAMIDD